MIRRVLFVYYKRHCECILRQSPTITWKISDTGIFYSIKSSSRNVVSLKKTKIWHNVVYKTHDEIFRTKLSDVSKIIIDTWAWSIKLEKYFETFLVNNLEIVTFMAVTTFMATSVDDFQLFCRDIYCHYLMESCDTLQHKYCMYQN